MKLVRYLDVAKFRHDGLSPIDVRGYWYWSLTDAFEWQYGRFSRYGLIEIDHDQASRASPAPALLAMAADLSADAFRRSRAELLANTELLAHSAITRTCSTYRFEHLLPMTPAVGLQTRSKCRRWTSGETLRRIQ